MPDEYRCLVCWRTFDGPGDLAAHEQDEEDAGFPNPLALLGGDE